MQNKMMCVCMCVQGKEPGGVLGARRAATQKGLGTTSLDK